jgi:hypothetical protein
MSTTSKTSPSRADYQPVQLVSALVIYILSLVLEYYALQLTLAGSLLPALGIHVIASLAITWPLCFFMPLHFRANSLILIFLFLLCFLIPLVSGICLLLSLTLTLFFTKQHKEDVFEYTEPLHAENIIKNTDTKPDFCNGRMFGILRFSSDADKRIKAVLATSGLDDKVAVPILQIALLDSVDEVRLMAYSILDTKEKEIDSQIHKGLSQLKMKDNHPEIVKKIHHKLAEAYWELSYLGLVKGRAREHTLQAAREQAHQAIKLGADDIGLFFLQVQILTSLGYFKEASILLEKVKEKGISPEKLASRRAELAFELKSFSKTSEHVKELVNLAENNVILDGMVKQWI